MQWTGFQVFHFLLLSLLAFSRVSLVLGTITVTVEGDIFVHVPHDISWTRDAKDPDTFYLTKVRIGQKPHPNNETVHVVANGATSGTAQIPFHHKASYFVLVTSDKDDERKLPLAFSNNFGVDKSSSSENGSDEGPISALSADPLTIAQVVSFSTIPLPTSATRPTMTPNSNMASQSDSQEKQESMQTAVIVASVLGALVILIIAGILLYLYRRSSIARRDKAFSRSMVFRNPSMTHNINFDSAVAHRDPEAMYPDVGRTEYLGASNKTRDPDSAFDDRKSIPLGFDSNREKSFRFPSIISTSDVAVPTLHFAPLTDRQMDIQERIFEWESKVVFLREEKEIEGARANIEALRRLQRSDWALGLTDEIPHGLS